MNERRRLRRAAEPELRPELEAAPRLGPVQQVADATGSHVLGSFAVREQFLAKLRLAGDQGLAGKQLAKRSEVVVIGLIRERARESLAATERRVDLLAGEVILELDA